MQQLSVLVSSTFYARLEPYSIIEKIVRDLEFMPFLPPAGPSCLLTILANLPDWAERSGLSDQTDLRLFDATDAAPLPPLDFTAFGLSAGTTDPLGSALRDARIREALAADAPNLVPLVSELAEGLERERTLARRLAPDQLTAAASGSAFDIARRISLYLAAGSVVGTWMAARGSDTVAADPLVIEACLRRLTDAVARHRHPLAPGLVDRLVAHAETCVAQSRSMTLHSVAVYRSAGT